MAGDARMDRGGQWAGQGWSFELGGGGAVPRRPYTTHYHRLGFDCENCKLRVCVWSTQILECNSYIC